MAEWRYLLARLHGDGTEEILHPDIRLLGVGMTDVLSGPPGLTARISPADPFLLGNAIDGLPYLEEWSTAIYAEVDDTIRGGFILESTRRTGPTLELTGVGFSGYAKGMPYAGSTYFVETDPLDIVRHIWAHIQGQIGGDIGLVLGATTTGKKIGTTLEQVEFDAVNGPVSFEAGPYKLNDYSTDDLGAKVDALASDHGFDYHESHAWNADGSAVIHRLDFGYPRIGTRRTDMRFTVGVNVFSMPTEGTTGEDYYSAVLTRGAGEGSAMKRVLIARAGERRLRRVLVVEDKALKSNAAVSARSNAILPLVTGRSDISQLVVIDHPDAPLGGWSVGDELEVFTESEWGDDSMWVRILSVTINPEQQDVATVSVMRADKIPT